MRQSRNFKFEDLKIVGVQNHLHNNQPINQSTDQPEIRNLEIRNLEIKTQSTNQPINQSTNQPINPNLQIRL